MTFLNSSKTPGEIMKDYYKLLEIDKTASEHEIDQAIRRQTRRYLGLQNHPEQHRRQEAERVMKELAEAKTILLDANKRQQYDRDLARNPPETRQVNDNNLSQNSSELIKEAEELIADGQIPDAIVVAERATLLEPTNADAWAVSARAKAKWGETREADYEFKKAISQRRNYAPFYFDYGFFLQSTADSQKYMAVANSPDEALMKALEQFERAYSIDPQTIYLQAQGLIYTNSNTLQHKTQYKQGIEILERCVAQEPEDERYKENLGYAYLGACILGWTYVTKEGWQEAYYATERAHIDEAQLYIIKAQSLNLNDETIISSIRTRESLIVANLKRHFTGSWILAIVGGLIYSRLAIVFVPLYWFSARVTQYNINNKLLNNRSNNIVDTLFGGSTNGIYRLIVLIICGILFPVIILLNFFSNYKEDIQSKIKAKD
jgi:tetratricopeptide (TPR) repeat protein